MTLEKIFTKLEILAAENMTEDGIHHDDWPDHENEYIESILEDLQTLNQ